MGFFKWFTTPEPDAAPPLGRPEQAGFVDGAHYSAKAPELDRLRKAGRLGEYESLLWRCVDATEAESRRDRMGIAPAYYERLAILFRKQGRPADEVAVLERYDAQRKAPGVGPGKLAERLRKLRR